MPSTETPDRPLPGTKPLTVHDLTGAQKSAVLLIALGTEISSSVLRALEDKEVEEISIAIAQMRNVSSDIVEDVLLEYRDTSMARDYVAQGGTNFAREVLEGALGGRRAEEIMMKVEAAMEVSAFHLLQTVETAQLTNFLQNEHPQTAALILANLNPRKAADIISSLATDRQNQIMYRLATMGKTSPELLQDIEDVIRQQIGSVFGAELSVTGGIEKVAEILNSVSRTSERSIIDAIRAQDGDLATDIKNLMFVFDDLVQVSDQDLQTLLQEVEQKDLALSLKAAPESLKEKVFANVSDRVSETLREEIDLMGPVRVSDVDEAQRRILDIAQELEEREEIVLSGAGEDQLI